MPLPQLDASPPARLREWMPTDEWLVVLGDDAAIGLFEIDLRTHEVRWSHGLFTLFGVDPDAPVGADVLHERIHPDDAAARRSAFERAVADGTGGRYAADYRVMLPDGDVRWLSAHGRVLKGTDGTGGLRLVGAVTDETTRRVAAAELATIEKRRDRFLALLAHDLRNPLAPLHTAAELMRRAEMAPARIVTISDMLTRQVRQLSLLIDDLVDVSRASQGRIELHRQPVDLCASVEQAVAAVRPFVERRRQTVVTRFDLQPAMLEADAERLVQIVTHLIEHASRASTEDAEIRIGVEAADGPDEVRLSVEDDGAGIEPDQLAQVFDLYPPAETDPNRRLTLGTGMALVKALAVLHGGRVDASSAGAGQGATYTVHLPT